MSDATSIDRRVRQLRIIIGGMIVGVLTLTCVALSGVVGPDEPDLDLAIILGGVWVALAMIVVVGYVVFRGSVLARVRRAAAEVVDGDDEEVLSAVVKQCGVLTQVSATASEALGLFAGVIVLVTGERAAAVGSLVSLIALALLFPSKSGWASLASSLAGRQIRID